MKKILAAVIVFLVLLLLYPSVCVEGAKNGLLLWFNTIIPTLFPFILATNLIRELGGIPVLERIFAPLVQRLFRTGPEGAYPVVLGFLCGYPMGAKAVADSLSCRRISVCQASYLLTFTNNPSPIYMLSYVALFTLNTPALGFTIVAVACISAVVTAFVCRHIMRRRAACPPAIHPLFAHRQHRRKRSPGRFDGIRAAGLSAQTGTQAKTIMAPPEQALEKSGLFDRCVLSAFELLVKIGSYMILFSILAAVLTRLPAISPLAVCILAGLLEQTTGLALLKALTLPLAQKTALAAGMICFGGLCIAAQTYSVIRPQGLSVKPYLLSKLFTGITAAALALLCTQLPWFP